MKRLKELWIRISGHTDSFSDENRAFNAMAFLTLCVLVYTSAVNVIIGELFLALIAAGLFALLVVLYYFSRVLKKYNAGRYIFAFLSQAFLLLNYFFNAGIDGPTLIFEFVVFFFLIVLFPSRKAFIWVVLTLVLPLIAIGVEYSWPELVEGGYSSRYLRFLDIFFAYVLAVVFVVLSLLFLKSLYEKQERIQRNLAEKLEVLNQENQKLFSIISHDLRSPLLTIEGYLKEMTNSEIDHSYRRILEYELLHQTENTSGMLDNLLIWSKQKIDGKGFTPVHFKFMEVMSDSLSVLEKMALRKSITFTFAAPSDLVLYGEPRQIEILLRNLIQNAIKFTEANGQVNLTVENVGSQTVITINDTGVGIKKEKLEAIFSEKVQSTFGTNNEKGIGIGLNLCQEITMLHQGLIAVESTANVGTKFIVTLPNGYPKG